jgi:hypothetical protein
MVAKPMHMTGAVLLAIGLAWLLVSPATSLPWSLVKAKSIFASLLPLLAYSSAVLINPRGQAHVAGVFPASLALSDDLLERQAVRRC